MRFIALLTLLADNATNIPPPIYVPPMRQPSPIRMPTHLYPDWRSGAAGPVASDPAVPQLQREIDNLRRENERIQREASERAQRDANERARREASERMLPALPEAGRPPITPAPATDHDAGPAGPPPPYSDSHYIP